MSVIFLILTLVALYLNLKVVLASGLPERQSCAFEEGCALGSGRSAPPLDRGIRFYCCQGFEVWVVFF